MDNHYFKSYFFHLFILGLLATFSYSKTIEEIELPYNNPSLKTTIEKESLFKVMFPIDFTYIKIKTSPKLVNEVVNFYLSYDNEEPNYSTAILKTQQLGDTIFFLKKPQQTFNFFFLRISSLNPETEYSLSLEVLTTESPYILATERLSSDIGFLKSIEIHYEPFDEIEKQHLIIYAIGAFRDDFNIEIKHKCENEDETLETTTEMFYNGYGAIIDLINKNKYKGGSTCKFIIYLIQSKNSCLIKYGSFYPKDTKNSKIDLFNPVTYYAYLQTSERQCFPIINTPLVDGETKAYIFSVNTYPYNSIKFETFFEPNEPLSIFEFSNHKETFSSTFILQATKENKYLCLSTFDKKFYPISIAFTITPYDDSERYQLYKAPLVNGYLSQQITKRGEVTAFKRGRFVEDQNNEKAFLKKLSGKVNFYHYFCQEYPCIITREGFDTLVGKTPGYTINEDSMYSLFYNSEKQHSSKKHLYLVECESKDEDCVYIITNALENDDIINLEPEIDFYNVMGEGITAEYSFYNYNDTLKSLGFEIYSVSGSVKASISYSQGLLKPKHTFPGNKEVIIYVNSEVNPKHITGKYTIKVTGKEFSYFSVKVIRDIQTVNLIEIPSGMISLQSVTPSNPKKFFKIYNRNIEYNYYPYTITLYPVNCAISYTIGDKIRRNITVSDNFMIEPQDPVYSNKTFYIEVEYQEYSGIEFTPLELCFFYISGSESSDIHPLVLNEASEFRNIFMKDKLSSFKHVFPLVFYYYAKQLTISLDLEGRHDMTMNVIINKVQNFTYKIYKETTIFYDKDITLCPNQLVCEIEIELKVDSWIEDILEYGIRVTSHKSVPFYIKDHNKILKDIIPQGMSHYYYSGLEIESEGSIYVNFIKGGGKIYARIVPKLYSEDKANWHNHVELPSKDTKPENLLTISYPFNVVTYTKTDTEKCYTGCEIFIGIYNNYGNLDNSLLEYSISLRKINKSGQGYMINVRPDLYTSGIIKKKDNYDVYSVRIFGFEEVTDIILRSNYGELYALVGNDINVGEKKYTVKSTEPNSVITINKTSEFILVLSIAVYMRRIGQTKKSEVYSFKVISGYSNKNFNVISQENGEICKFIDKNSRCLLILSRQYYEVSNIAYLTINNIDNNFNVQYEIYATIMKESEYWNYTEIPDDKIPSPSNYQFTSLNQHRRDTILVTLGDEYKNETTYVLFSILASEPNIARVIASNKQEISYLPLSVDYPSIFYLNKQRESRVILSINSNQETNYLNIYTLYGKGLLKYNIYSEVEINKPKISTEIIQTPNGLLSFIVTPTTSEFMIYVEFDNDINSHQQNDKFGKIHYGEDNDIIYKDEKGIPFPHIYYFDKIEENEYLNIEVKFKDYILKNNSTNADFDNCNFELIGYFANTNFMDNKKYDHQLSPTGEKSIYHGQFDHIALRGYLGLPVEKNKMGEDNKYIIVELKEKNSKKIFSSLSYDIKAYPSIYLKKQTLIISQNIYHYFVLNSSNGHVNILKLSNEGAVRGEKESVWFYHIEFASSFPSSDYILSFRQFDPKQSIDDPEIYKNQTEQGVEFGINEQYSGGKYLLDINVPVSASLLMVVKATNTSIPSLGYVMKYYVDGGNKAKDKEFYAVNNTLTHHIVDYVGNTTFNLQTNFTWDININKGYFYYSVFDSLDISKENAGSICFDYVHPISSKRIPFSGMKEYSVTLENVELKSLLGYVSIVAHFYNETSKREVMLAYEPQEISLSSNKLWIYLAIGGAGLVLIIIVVLIIIKCKKNKKDQTPEELLLQKSINTESMLGPVI